MLKFLLTLLICLLVPWGAMAESTAVLMWQDTRCLELGSATCGLRLSAVACNAAAASRWTGWMRVDQKRSVAFDVDLVDANSDETSIDVRCETARANNVANDAGRDLISHISTSSAGVTTTVPGTLRQTSTSGGAPGSSSWVWVIDNIPGPYLNCLFVCNGAAAAADSLTVFARGITP